MAAANSLVIMPGPNLSAGLPGVKMHLAWPQAVMDQGGALAARARAMLRQDLPLPDGETNSSSDALGQLAIDIAKGMLALQGMAGREQGKATVAIRSQALYLHHRDTAVAALVARATARIIAALLEGRSPAAPLAETKMGLKAFEFGESSWRKIATAEQRNIPWRRLVAYERILQFGHGCRQVRSKDSMSDSESYIGAYLTTHKHITSELLLRNGLPAPRNMIAADRTAAVQMARALGLPVVVKPATTDFGTSISVNLAKDEDIVAAFDRASKHGPVLVEQQIAGDHYRLLVMHGKFLAAVRQDPAHVTGDGTHRIDELVEIANRSRSDSLSASLKTIKVDDEVLRVLGRQGLALNSIPSAGQRVLLREHSNLSVGGTYRNVTAEVHPDNRFMAERAAGILGLKVAGIDFITADITRSYRDIGGGICEVNVTPGFVMGQSGYAVEETYFDHLFPGRGNGRIPIVAVLSDQQEDTLLERMEAVAAKCGHRAIAATPRTLRIGAQTIAAGSFGQRFCIEAALQDPTATATILQLTRAGTAEEGLIFDRCDLAIVDPDRDGEADPAGPLLARHTARLVDIGDRSGLEGALAEVLGRNGASR